jgi:acetyl-CoA C-acetyltransferase
MHNVMVISAARTPIGAFLGKLGNLSEQQLGAAAMLEVVDRAGIKPEKIEEVIIGIAKQTSKPSNGGRHAMLLARLPENIPAYTVQRQSASGLQAVVNGYWAIQCGDAGVILAGGTESMSQIPFEIRNARYAFTGKEREIIDAIAVQEVGAQPRERYGIMTTALVAENYIRKHHLRENDLREFAERSLQKTLLAADKGLFKEETVSVTVNKGKKEELVDRDELQNKPMLLAPPADAAAMCLLASPAKVKELGLPILAEIVSVGIAATDPRYAGMAVVEASRKAIEKSGIALQELDVIELNEMSAAECLAIFHEWCSWGIDRELLMERVNPSGGSLSLGNPWGASGVVQLTKIIHELRRRGGQFGMVALTAEGGQGMAMILRNNSN